MTSAFTIYDNMVYLVGRPTIRGLPCALMDVFVWEDGSADDQVATDAEISKAYTAVVSFATSVPDHCPPRVVSSHFGIHVPS